MPAKTMACIEAGTKTPITHTIRIPQTPVIPNIRASLAREENTAKVKNTSAGTCSPTAGIVLF